MSEEKEKKPKPKTPPSAEEIPWTPDETQVRTIELEERPKKKKSESEKEE